MGAAPSPRPPQATGRQGQSPGSHAPAWEQISTLWRRLGTSGRWSGQDGIPTLERGKEKAARSERASQVLPAIGGEDGGVEFVVELAQDRDQALFVDELFLGAQGLAAAQLLQHVVHAGHGQPGVQGLAGLAVGVQFLGELPDGSERRG